MKVLKVFFNGMTVSVVLRASFKKISENFNSNGSIEGHIVKTRRAVGLSTVQFPTSLAAQLPFKSKSIILLAWLHEYISLFLNAHLQNFTSRSTQRVISIKR